MALTLAALFWSGNFIAGRALRDDIDPVTLNTLRWTLACVVFLPFVAPVCRAHAGAVRRHLPYLLTLGATGIAAFHTAVYIALTQTTAANALLVLALAPVAILMGSALIRASRPTRAQWAGSAVSLAGATVLITGADIDVLRGLALNLGDLWMLAAVVIWAAYTLLLKRRPADLPPTVTLAASMIIGTGLMLPLALLNLPWAHLAITPGFLSAMAYIVVFPSVLAFWLWGHGVARIGPERAGQFVHLMPVFGPVLAMAILGETVSTAQVTGAAIVFIGVIVVIRGARE
jgi:drug/metabolite transporter (DMT)-like permease